MYTSRLKAVIYVTKTLQESVLNLHKHVGQNSQFSRDEKKLRFAKDGIYIADFMDMTFD